TSIGPTAAASLFTASVLRTSRVSSFTFPALSSPASFERSTSVATISAPSRANASAVARPMPWPAAVMNTRLPSSRPIASHLLGIFGALGACLPFDRGMADAVGRGKPRLDPADRRVGVGAAGEPGVQRRHQLPSIEAPQMHVVDVGDPFGIGGEVRGD